MRGNSRFFQEWYWEGREARSLNTRQLGDCTGLANVVEISIATSCEIMTQSKLKGSQTIFSEFWSSSSRRDLEQK